MKLGLPGKRLRQLASLLGLLSSLALLVLVTAFFYRPMRAVLGPNVLPAVSRMRLPAFFSDGPAKGFLLQITSKPPGAKILIDGAPRGNTPAILNVICTEGQSVSLTVRKRGFPEFRQSVRCRQGQSALARIDLRNPGA